MVTTRRETPQTTSSPPVDWRRRRRGGSIQIQFTWPINNINISVKYNFAQTEGENKKKRVRMESSSGWAVEQNIWMVGVIAKTSRGRKKKEEVGGSPLS